MKTRSAMLAISFFLVGGCDRPGTRAETRPADSLEAVAITAADCKKLGGTVEDLKPGETKCYNSSKVCSITTKDPRTGIWKEHRPCVSDAGNEVPPLAPTSTQAFKAR